MSNDKTDMKYGQLSDEYHTDLMNHASMTMKKYAYAEANPSPVAPLR
jgi:hypothetical protein